MPATVYTSEKIVQLSKKRPTKSSGAGRNKIIKKLKKINRPKWPMSWNNFGIDNIYTNFLCLLTHSYLSWLSSKISMIYSTIQRIHKL